MLPIRTVIFTLFAAASLATGAAWAAETVVLMDAGTAMAAESSGQARMLGSKMLWLPAPGAEIPTSGQTLRAADDEELYLIREHGAAEVGRVLAAWDDFRLVAIRVGDEQARFHHCAERVGWLPPAPRAMAALRRRTSAREKDSVVSALNLTHLTETMRRLAGDLPVDDGVGSATIDTRWTYSAAFANGISLAEAYLIQRFEEYGYDVLVQEFAAPEGTARNLIAVREGGLAPNEVVVVGAHYDSISEISSVRAPGAEDNASGTAAVLELARVFARVTPERSIHFVCFSAEEQGLHGSRHYVSKLGENGWSVAGAFTMDMIAAWTDDYGVLIEGDLDSDPIMQSLDANAQALGTISTEFSYAPFGSDHVPFIQANLPALLAIDLDWAAYAGYHKSTDLFESTDPTLGLEIARAIAGAVVDLAGTLDVVRVDDVPPPAPDALTLALADPFPNPFNPRTVIDYTIPREGPVSVRIHDARGRVVRRLVEGTVSAGRATTVWDGEDEDGRAVASGLYFVRLEHDEGVLARRAVLVR